MEHCLVRVLDIADASLADLCLSDDMIDLRKAHIGRSDGAAKSTVAEELKKDLEEVVNFEGSYTEQLLLVFCKQTKLRYNRLSEEEKQWLIRIIQKSELIKSSISKRGKGKNR